MGEKNEPPDQLSTNADTEFEKLVESTFPVDPYTGFVIYIDSSVPTIKKGSSEQQNT